MTKPDRQGGDGLRQPTEAMLNAARDWSVAKYGRGIGNDAAIGCWQAMLDAAPPQPAPDAMQSELERTKANHKDAVETKRRTDARLRVALAALQQIYTVCNDNAGENCDQRMTVDFIRQVAGDGFEKATSEKGSAPSPDGAGESKYRIEFEDGTVGYRDHPPNSNQIPSGAIIFSPLGTGAADR